MRTIRCEMVVKIDATTDYTVETEVIVEDDEDIEGAGREAMRVMRDFIRGAATLEDE